MQVFKFLLRVICLSIIICLSSKALSAINILAAENFYGSIAKQIGGVYVNVVSILDNPNQDPHLFSINPSTIKIFTESNIIIYNGADYDAWMQPLINKQSPILKKVIVVADLVKIRPLENPHIWYDPETMFILAKNLTELFSLYDQEHKKFFEKQFEIFQQEYLSLLNLMEEIKKNYQNLPVIATEPIFNYMAIKLGMKMYGQTFQQSIMNDITPSVSQIKSFEDLLRKKQVKLIIFNWQVDNPMTKKMLEIADEMNIPKVGVSETLPPGMTYVQWMVKQLLILKKSLDTGLKSVHGH